MDCDSSLVAGITQCTIVMVLLVYTYTYGQCKHAIWRVYNYYESKFYKPENLL